MFEIIPMNHSSYNPFRDFNALAKSFFDSPSYEENVIEPFRTDIKETDTGYTLEADLPGFEKKDISVGLEGDYLTIKAERHSEHEDKDKKDKYIRCERSYGSYARSFDITGVDTEKISAKYDNGVLTLDLPRKEPKEPASRLLDIE